MAEIKMDISEYELMKENKRLYEESLKKERELQLQITQLTNEKLKALEDAKMKVVKISKTEVHEHIFVKRNINEIKRFLYDLVNSPSLHHTKYPQGDDYIESLIDSLFTKASSYSIPTETVTTYGLDEIKEELRQDLKKEMDEDTVLKLENAKSINEQYWIVKKENETLVTNNVLLQSNNTMLEAEVEGLEFMLKDSNRHSEILFQIQGLLQNGYTCWNKSKLLDEIIKLIK